MKGVVNMNEMPDSVLNFINNYRTQHSHPINDKAVHFTNVYHIITEDRDGNITDEKFGTNVLTNRGLTMFSNDWYFNGSKPITLEIGTGTSAIDPSSANLETYVAVSNDCYTITLLSDTTPLQFDSNTGVVSGYINRDKFTFDYNISGISEDKTITEMGLTYERGGNNSRLITHSRVYDEYGVESSFVKHINEKVYVTVYLGISMNLPTVINALWTDHNYAIINPYYFLTKLCQQLRIGDYYGACYHYSLFIKMMDRYYHNSADDSSTFDPLYNGTVDTTNGTVTATKTWTNGGKANILYEQGWVSKQILIDCGGNNHGREAIHALHIMIDHDTSMHLASPEVIELTAMSNFRDNTFTDALWTYCSSNSYNLHGSKNYRGRLQLNQLNVTHMQMYDHNTHQWEDEDFLQDTSFIYDHSFLYRIHYKTTLNGSTVTVYIYMNNKFNDYPILKLNTDATSVWATDTYWDPSSWVEVTKGDVEQAYRSKRFYIINSNVDMIPVYDYTPLQLDNVTPGYTIDGTGIRRNADSDYVMEMIPNPKNNCIVCLNQIVYPDDPSDVVMFPISNYGNKENRGLVSTQPRSGYSATAWSLSIFKITEDGDRLILAHKNRTADNANDNYGAGCYRIYTISDDKTVAPTYVDVQIPYTTTTYDTPTRHSFTDKGYVVSNHNEDKEVGIVDLYAAAGSETYVIPDAQWGHALNRTTLCVYRDASDLSILKFNVYDMSTQTVTKSFTINGDYTMNGIGGWKNHVYIRVYDNTHTQYVIIYYDITNDTSGEITDPISTTDVASPFNMYPSGIWDCALRSCDEALVLPVVTGSSQAVNLGLQVEFRIIFANDPTNIRDLKTEMGYSNMYTGGRFMTNSDGSFLALEIATNENSSYIASNYEWQSEVASTDYGTKLLDIGDLYDNNHFDTILYTNQTNNNRRNAIHTLYKDYDIRFPNAENMTFNPERRSRIHKIIGTTDTIQSINNPKRVTPTDTFTFRVQRN